MLMCLFSDTGPRLSFHGRGPLSAKGRRPRAYSQGRRTACDNNSSPSRGPAVRNEYVAESREDQVLDGCSPQALWIGYCCCTCVFCMFSSHPSVPLPVKAEWCNLMETG